MCSFLTADRFRNALAFFALFLVTAFANLAFSIRSARLASVPTNDDVGYLADALDRVMFAGDGLWSMLRSMIASPPHAPVVTLTGAFGFWAFGPEPIAAYIANLWVLGLYVALFARLSRPLGGLLPRALFVAIMVYVPIAHAMVTEFRPDMAAGLLFAIALFLGARTDLRRATWPDLLLVIAAAIAATIMKPSGVILVIPALCISLGMTLLAQGLLKADSNRALLLRRAILIVAGYGVALLPFSIVFGRNTVGYIIQALVTNSDIWVTPGDRWFHWTYHMIGPGAQAALGFFIVPVWCLVVADIILYVRWSSWRRPGILPYYATLAIVYCAMAISNEKTIYQGSFFYMPLLLAAASALVRMAVAAGPRVPHLVPGMLALTLGVCILFLPIGSSYVERVIDAPQSGRLLAGVTDAILDLNRNEWVGHANCDTHGMRIMTLNYEPLTADIIRFALARQGLRVKADGNYFPRSLDEAMAVVGRVDIIVMADPAAPRTNDWLLIGAYAPEIFRRLSADLTIRKIQVGTYLAKPFWMFVKPQCAEVAKPSS